MEFSGLSGSALMFHDQLTAPYIENHSGKKRVGGGNTA